MSEIKPKKERRFLKTLGRVGEILVEQVLLKLGSSIIKKIGGKKTLPSILFIFLSLSLFAQFPNTGNKQRLGFQTTGDGLTWRGSISDTASIQPINNQNAWVILDTINLKFYSFDFTSNVWNLVGGAPGLTMPFDSITFNTAKNGTVGVGEVEYNDTQGSLIQGLKGGLVTNVIGQQLHQRVNNRTGSTLTKGTAVYLSGSQGNRITVAKGLAVSDAFSANTFGVVAESIADNASGYIITEGLITGLNTSALTEDSAVYLSPTVAGGLTSTKPQAPQHSIYIGVCVKSNNGSGELFVKIRNGQELDELHDVRITSPLNNASLYYKSNEGLWRDTTATLLVSDTASMLANYNSRINLKLNISDTTLMLSRYLRRADTSLLNLTSRFATKLNYTDTSFLFTQSDTNQLNLTSRFALKANLASPTFTGTVSGITKSMVGLDNVDNTSDANKPVSTATQTALNLKVNISDTTNMLLPYLRDADTVTLSNRINLKLNISDTSAFARDNQISGTSGQVAYFNGSNSVTSNADLIYNAASNTLGINTTTTTGANLIIKNSQEPVRDTFVGTQTFAADTTNWMRGTGWTFSGGFAVATAATGDLTYNPSLTVTSGNAYEITYTLTGYTGGTFSVILGNGAAIALPTYNVTGYVVLTLPTNITGGFRFTTSSFTGNLDNITVVQISNAAPVLFAGQDDNTSALYNSLRMPTATTLAFGGGGGRTTGVGNNTFIGTNAGLYNTTGSNNNFIGNQAGFSNTTGSNNNFFGLNAGQNNTIGNNNSFYGPSAGLSNTTGTSNIFFGNSAGRFNLTGSNNIFFGTEAGQFNTTGTSNIYFGVAAGENNRVGTNNTFFGLSAGRSNRGSFNLAFGDNAFNNTTVGDTLTGSNNIAIGTNAGDNIEFAAANNLIIGNGIDLPIDGGSNQVAIKNVYFATDATGAAKNIAASSKAGIKTATPNRDLEVAGEVRITDLTTDAPTRLVGADADGDLGQVTLGAGLSLASSSLLADTNFLVTRFDTASMLTNYLRTGTAASTYLLLTGGTLTGDLYSKYLNTFAKTTYIPFNAGIGEQSIFNVGTSLRGGTVMVFPDSNLVGSSANIFLANSNVQGVEYSAMGSGIRNYSKQGGDNRRNSLAFYTSGIASQNTNRLYIDYDGNVGINDDTPSYKLDVSGTLNATGATTLGSTLAVTGNITEAGLNVLTSGDTTSMLLPYLRKVDTASLSNRINLKFNTADTSQLNLTSRFAAKLNLADTIKLTTFGTSNAATLINKTLNIPNYKTLTVTNPLQDYLVKFSDNIGNGIQRSNISESGTTVNMSSSDVRLGSIKNGGTFSSPITISTACGSSGSPNLIGTSTGNYVNNCSTGTAYLLLPDPADISGFTVGRILTITNLRSTQSITLNTSGSYSNARPLGMDAVAETSIAAKRWITVQSNGTNWYIIATGSAL